MDMADPQTPKTGGDGQTSLITSASLPTTATAITLVTTAALGAEQVGNALGMLTPREYAVIAFAALVSIFATCLSTLPALWKVALSPVNFCILVYLSFASLNLVNATKQSEPAGAPTTSTYVIRSTPIAPPTAPGH
jgi:hypothetical protein